MTQEYDVVIVGSGVGGCSTAALLAKDHGKKVLVLEKAPHIGGRVASYTGKGDKVTIDGREVRMVRPEGQAEVVERHAATTIDRALAPRTRERVTTEPGRGDRRTSMDSRSIGRSSPSAEKEREKLQRTSHRGSSAASAVRSPVEK